MTTLTTPARKPNISLSALVTTLSGQPIPAFMALNFGAIWLLALFAAILPFFPLAVLAAFMPALTAAVLQRGNGQSLSWREAFRLPSGIQWYMMIALPALSGLIIYALTQMSGQWIDYPLWPMLAQSIVLVWGLAASERIGWRGFALRHLLENQSRWRATLSLAIMMAIVYLPIFLLPSFAQKPYFLHLPFIFATLVLFTWVWNRTHPVPIEGGLRARRWYSQIARSVGRGLFSFILITVVTLATSAFHHALSTPIEQNSLKPLGQIISVGDHNLHLLCEGEGNPTIVLEAGRGGWSADWGLIQPELAKTTRVCSYDRADFGWSEMNPAIDGVADGRVVAKDLYTLLHNAGIEGPYVMVGHSMGGMYIRIFADMYPDNVAGLVLIDPTNPRVMEVIGMTPEQGDAGAPLNHSIMMLLTNTGLVRPFAIGVGSKELAQERIAMWPTTYHMEATYPEEVWGKVMYQAMEAEDFGDTPLAVVVATVPERPAEFVELEQAQTEMSTNRLFKRIFGADHGSIMWEQQYASQTIAVILDVWNAAQSGEPLPQE